MTKYKLKNGFKVHELLLKVDADYLFSKSEDDDFYRLLNIDVLGHIESEHVDKLMETEKVIVINNDTMEMTAHNIDDTVMMSALMEMS